MPKAAANLSQRLAAWQQKPEFAAVAASAALNLDAAGQEDLLALWEVLSGLSADADMLLAAAVYLAPALQSEQFSLKPEQLRLLDGLTASRKVWDIYRQHGRSGNAEGLRRLLLAIILDLRVLIVLLAWQLVQMRKAVSWPEPERLALAHLTADIHAPLANRLGIWQLKWELEDLAFRIMKPEQYQAIARQLQEKRGLRERYIEQAAQQIRAALAQAGIDADVAGRPKHITSIWKKMQRKNLDFEGLYDIRAIRVLVDDVAACYSVLGLVHQLWTPIPGEFDDYIAQPKSNNYQSLHTAVIGPEGLGLEVQIRTRKMHEHAEMGVAAHWRYKEGGKAQGEFEKKIAQMRQLLENSRGADDTVLMAGLGTELVEDRKYLLTPKGEVIDLPAAGTVLDFAYHVHTDVGHRCRGAKVNGRIVPLEFQPSSGDRVEIMTGKTGAPKRDWLLAANGYLASSRSRDKVRAYFFRLDRQRNLEDGRELLEKELRRVALMQADLKPALEKFKLPDRDELCIALALGDISPSLITRALHEHLQPAAEAAPVRRAPAPRKETGRSDMTVEGVGNLLMQLARCCQPVPGDAIVGYLTKGKGVSIHRSNCASAAYLIAQHPERELPVNWGSREDGRYEVSILIRAYDRKWLLKDLTNLIAQANVNIAGVNTLSQGGPMAELKMNLKVADFGQLSALLGKLDAVPGVLEVRRF
ncbi:bifunctional (p)ppGpp synthetase/guanosine-3',5'-bis(diphosphate) 3'-pyrophosphohydrolase [Arenimonas sp. GDDSR-1]|uniref:RelA/SpoT family protein n=1 Tax=Arenimonas sp. GDDSR-1 TaxID=2950125 RepID=UPI0026245EB1|nr:bifunctional (p)ppGpp synthetase/guanosine-3',5'-bis(diphosphate) 3'-pyrophosphohydrolase [Arenimonas sp. GDDSR-1]